MGGLGGLVFAALVLELQTWPRDFGSSLIGSCSPPGAGVEFSPGAGMACADSTLLFSAAMAQIKTPKTAFATTSATEYPICSPDVAVTPEIPSILMMYTKGYVNQEMTVSQR